MRFRTIQMVGVWAMGGFLVTLGLMAPARLDAVAPTTAPVYRAGASKLVVDGVELSLKYGDHDSPAKVIDIKDGTKLDFTLIARNTTSDSVDLNAKLSILSTTLPSKFARVSLKDHEAWKTEQSISIPAGETVTIPIVPKYYASVGQELSLQLTCEGQSIRPLRFSTGVFDPTKRQ